MDWPLTNPVLVFATVMLIVLLAPPLFRRMGLPGLVGLIVSGAVVGPNALGMLERGSTFELLGTVGLLYLMFTAGLSLDLDQFIRYKTRSLTFGILSFLMPAGLALAVGTQGLAYDPASALLLGAVVGSHTLLAYPVAARLDITKNTAVTMTMGGTMVTDIISLLLLAAVSATVEGATGLGFWAGFVGLVTAYGVAVFWGLPRLGQWFFRTVRKQADLEFVFLMAVVFVVSYLAELVYLAPIIGAFLVGIALNQLVPKRSALMLRIEFVGDALFIPFFLISVGMLVDASVLLDGWTVGLYTLTFAGLVWGGKAVAAWGTGWLYGYSPAETWTIFGLSTPQAAATLAVTLVGFEMGLFDEAAVNAVVLLILLTALVGPWIVERFGRQVALQEETRPYHPSEAPQRILVPLSNPETADDLMTLALLLHAEDSTEPIYPITVVRDGPDVEARVAEGEDLLSHAVLHAADAEIPVVPLTRVDYNVAGGMVRAITEERISTVVVGWSGDSSARSFIFGSVLDQVLQETEEMILVSRMRGPIAANTRLLVAVPPYAERERGFPGAARALKGLASRAGLDLVLLSTEAALPTLQARFEATPPDMAVTGHAMDEWRVLVPTLDAIATEDDVIALVSEREGSVAWRPSLRRLPGLLNRRFENHTTLTMYMAETAVRENTATDVDRLEPDTLRPLFRPEDVVPALPDRATGPDGLASLIAETIGPTATPSELVSALLHDESYAPEIRSGIALYHTHTDALDETRVLVGLSAEERRLPRTSRPVHAVVVLLGGRSTSAETYLHHLSVLTALIGSADTVDELLACPDAEAVCEVLDRRLHEHAAFE